MTARWYAVTSAPYLYTERILDDGSGPTTEEREFLYVRATNAKRARAVAVKSCRCGTRFCYDFLEWNPFVGMFANRLTPADIAELRSVSSLASRGGAA